MPNTVYSDQLKLIMELTTEKKTIVKTCLSILEKEIPTPIKLKQIKKFLEETQTNTVQR